MDGQIVGVAVTAFVSVVTTVVTLLYGPAWKDRIDRRRAREQRSEQLLAKYSEPLARAAFDLQSRLYNSHSVAFRSAPEISESYRRLSTLWLLGQYLAWVEIVRREVQVIDYGDVGRTSSFQRHLFDVADILASSASVKDRIYRVFRADQRAIGELMVVERGVDGTGGADCMGYAEFCRRMDDDHVFARWFTSVVLPGDSIDPASAGLGESTDGHRGALLQRALIDLIDFFDPDQVRFPDRNERGKVPLPEGFADRKRLRPITEVARFRLRGDGDAVLAAWAADHAKTVRDRGGRATVQLSRCPWRTRTVEYFTERGYTEIHVRISDEAAGSQCRRDPGAFLSRSELKLINDLLRRLGRPRLVRTSRRSSEI